MRSLRRPQREKGAHQMETCSRESRILPVTAEHQPIKSEQILSILQFSDRRCAAHHRHRAHTLWHFPGSRISVWGTARDREDMKPLDLQMIRQLLEDVWPIEQLSF